MELVALQTVLLDAIASVFILGIISLGVISFIKMLRN